MLNIGEALKDQRISRNINQTQLSKMTNLTQQSISYWENNKKMPSIENCIILADFYGISLDELVGRHTIPLPKQINQTIHDNHGTINNKF